MEKDISIAEIVETVRNQGDEYSKTLLLRAFDEYRKYALMLKTYNNYEKDDRIYNNVYKYDDTYKDVERLFKPNDKIVLKVSSAYQSILEKLKKVEKSNVKNPQYFENDEFVWNAELTLAVLTSYILNFDVNNKEKINQAKDAITELECILKLPITFPENLRHFLSKTMEDLRGSKEKTK